MATKKKIKIDLKHDKPVVEDLDQSMKQAFYKLRDCRCF